MPRNGAIFGAFWRWLGHAFSKRFLTKVKPQCQRELAYALHSCLLGDFFHGLNAVCLTALLILSLWILDQHLRHGRVQSKMMSVFFENNWEHTARSGIFETLDANDEGCEGLLSKITTATLYIFFYKDQFILCKNSFIIFFYCRFLLIFCC